MTNLALITAAIFIAEGGTNAAVPYGILSVPVRKIEAYDNTNNRVQLQSSVLSVRDAGGNGAKGPVHPVFDESHARQICERTVVNTHERWRAVGRPGCFFDYLGDRYCPAAADPRGNLNWKRNVKRLLNHRRCDCRFSRADASHGPNGRSGINVETGSTAANVDHGSAPTERKP